MIKNEMKGFFALWILAGWLAGFSVEKVISAAIERANIMHNTTIFIHIV